MAAQQDADGQILADIGPDTTSEKAFSLKNAVSCPKDAYRFLLTSDSDFVRLPLDTIELSKSESTRVRVLFDSNGLDPGTHTANITVNCRNCGRCRARDKILRVMLTVVADGAATEDRSVEPLIEVVGDESELQVPAAGAIVAVGGSASPIPPVAGSAPMTGVWLAAISLLAIAAILLFFWRTSARTPAAPAASIEVRSIPDTGTQRVWSEGDERQRPVIRVRLAGDAGEQSVQGDPAAITEREW